MPDRALPRLSIICHRFASGQQAPGSGHRRRLVASAALLLALPALSFAVPASTSGASTTRLVAARPVQAVTGTPGGSTTLISPLLRITEIPH